MPTYSVLRHSFFQHPLAVWESGHVALSFFFPFFFVSFALLQAQTLFFPPASSIITPPSIHPGHCWVVVLSARTWRTQPLTYASPLWPGATIVLFAVLQLYSTSVVRVRCSGLFFMVGGRYSILWRQGNTLFIKFSWGLHVMPWAYNIHLHAGIFEDKLFK